MKKYWALFALSLAMGMLFPCHASAKEYCEVISGDGKTLGSEIACGEEHFYVIDSDGDQVRVLAKYSLNVGETIYREELPEPITDLTEKTVVCREIASQNGGKYNDRFSNTTFYTQMNGNEKYCFYSKGGATYTYNFDAGTYNITLPSYADIKQDARYVSAHWDEDGNYLYPQVGDTYLSYSRPIVRPNTQYDLVEEGSYFRVPVYDDTNYQGTHFADYTMSTQGEVGAAITAYKNKLTGAGYDVSAATLMTLDDLNSIAKQRGHEFDYQEIIDNKVANPHMYEYFSLKPYLDEEDSWIYDRTYWLRSGVRTDGTSSYPSYPDQMLFVDEKGDVCGTTSSGSYSSTACGISVLTDIGTGVRPLLTMPYDFIFRIRSETDGNGEIEVIDHSKGGESITFKSTAKAGFRLKSLKVSIDGGDEFEFDESEIEKDDEGYVTIKNGLFTMPFANVLVEATWAKIEPEPEPEPEPSKDEEEQPAEEEPSEEPVKEETPADNPATNDNIFGYLAIIPVLTLGLAVAIYKIK